MAAHRLPRSPWTALVGAACVVIVATADARADSSQVTTLLVQARADKEALRYQEARATLKRALHAGGATPAQLAAIYQLSGEISAGLDDTAAALTAFQHLLQIAPDTRLDDGVSPKIRAPFDRARTSTRRHGSLVLRYRRQPGRVVLLVDNDPLQLVDALVLRPASGGAGRTVRGTGRIEATSSAGLVVLAAIDRYGNELRVFGSRAVPIDLRAVTLERPLYARWYAWGLVSVSFAAAATAFGLAARSAEDELDALNRMSAMDPFTRPFSEAAAIESKARRRALLANIGVVAAAFSGVISVVLAVRGQRVSVTPTGAGVAAQLSW